MAQDPVEGGFDTTDFWRLYDDALPKIYGYLLRRSDRTIAEDLTQEVFTTVARVIASGDSTSITMPWLYTVAKSRLFDHFRAQRRAERNLAAVSLRTVDDERTVEEQVEARNVGSLTEQAIDALPATQRAVLVLHHLDDMSVAEVADRIGRSVRATESLLARARRTFRTAFEEANDA